MARYQVVATGKETEWRGGSHPHISSLCPKGGGKVSKAEAIRRIRAGIDSYYTVADGQVAEVKVIDRCDRCSTDYLRTDPDTTPRNNLLNLPDC